LTFLIGFQHFFVPSTKDYIKFQIKVAPRATLSRVTFGKLGGESSEGFLRWYHHQKEMKTSEAADSRGIELGNNV
jgi:hypothetical protein